MLHLNNLNLYHGILFFLYHSEIQIIMVCERQTSKQLTRNQIRETLLRQRVDMLSRRYLRDLRRSAFIDLRI